MTKNELLKYMEFLIANWERTARVSDTLCYVARNVADELIEIKDVVSENLTDKS